MAKGAGGGFQFAFFLYICLIYSESEFMLFDSM
jgi:hypothetical protein